MTLYKFDKHRKESTTRTKTNVTFVPQRENVHSLLTI